MPSAAMLSAVDSMIVSTNHDVEPLAVTYNVTNNTINESLLWLVGKRQPNAIAKERG